MIVKRDAERGPRVGGKISGSFAAAGMLALLAGCATSPAPVASAPPPAPMAATMPAVSSAGYDGIYSGKVTGGTPRTGRTRCNTVAMTARLRVTGDKAAMQWNGPFTGTASPDGSIKLSGSNGAGMEGSISGNTFNGTLVGTYCTYQVQLTKA